MGHNGGVHVVVMTSPPLAVDNDGMLQAGPYAFVFFVALGLSLVFLLFSMRKQIRRVDFDQAGTSDAERMRQSRASATPDDDGT